MLEKNGPSFKPCEWLELCERYGNTCLCCREEKPLEPDHVIPVTWGGGNTIDNIQPLCKSCNRRKGNRHATDYRITEIVDLGARAKEVAHWDAG